LIQERQRRVRELFDAAMDRPSELRREFVADACHDDPELLAQVERLLDASERASGMLDTPIRPRRDVEPVIRPSGSFVGPYRLLHAISSGGMGVVYQAVRADGVFSRVCAVKVIRAELSDDRLVDQFLLERRILARLDHPNIARILDGGSTEDGLPYFVMDYVDGPSIDKHCQRYQLSMRQRLALFQHACAAAQYLHRNGVVHGDFKPANILVGADGVVKVVDFGISRFFKAPHEGEDNPASPLMTPGYASPEQLRGEPLTPASDVYSLGVVLYDLLTGQQPFPEVTRTRAQLLRAITTQTPAPPSAAVKPGAQVVDISAATLRGDLDSIVLRAIHRDPAARYSSAEELNADLVRYLRRRPVLARHGGSFYAIAKFLARNTRASVAAALFFVMLASLSWESLELNRRHQRALFFQHNVMQMQDDILAALDAAMNGLPQDRTAAARELSRSLQQSQLNALEHLADEYQTAFTESVRLWPGMTDSRRELVDHAEAYLHRIEPLVQQDPRAAALLADAWTRLANIEGNPTTVNLHDRARAQSSIAEAQRIVENSPNIPANIADEVSQAVQQIGSAAR
jgi:eukaryotic-like serine/threonine-protein kinase